MNVYFLQSPATGLIKIGGTEHLSRRIVTLCSEYQEPLRLLGFIPGASEAQTQAKFAALWVWNEMFFPSTSLLQFAKSHRRPLAFDHPACRRVPKLIEVWPRYSYGARRVLAHDQKWRKAMVKPSLVRPLDASPLAFPLKPSDYAE